MLQLFGQNQNDPHTSCERKAISLLHLQDPFIPQGEVAEVEVGLQNCHVNTPKFQGSVDERASHGFPTMQPSEVLDFWVPFSNRLSQQAPSTLLCTQRPHGADAH